MAWPEEERPLVATNGGPDPEETPTDKNDRAEARNRRMEAVKTIFACAVYLSVGPALILVNRHILKEVGFDYPMALSGLGLIGAWLSSVFLIQILGVVTPVQSHLMTPSFVALNLAPIGAAMAGTLAAGNAVYLYLPVGFIQMLKAFTPTVTLAMLCLLRIEYPTTLVSLAVLGMCGGTATATMGAVDLNWLGLAIMLSSELCEAIRLVLTQKLLKNNNFGVVEGQYYMAPISAVWLFAAAAIFELPRALVSGGWRKPLSHPGVFLLSLALGACVNYCASAVIKLTNSVTLKVLATARNASLVLVSSAALSERVTPLELFGYVITLIAFAFYNYFRMRNL